MIGLIAAGAAFLLFCVMLLLADANDPFRTYRPDWKTFTMSALVGVAAQGISLLL